MPSDALRNLCDEELLDLVQKRDEAAFAELMSRTSSCSFKLALSILKDRQEAEDEVQNSYWNAWRSVEQFHRGSKFSTWMSRIVINQCLMRLRKGRQARFLYLDEGTDDGNIGVMELRDCRSTPEAALVDRERSAILHREIHRLPPLLRNVLVMRDLEEMPMDDVAVRLGISLVAAKSRLLRARTELRNRLERFGASIQAPLPAASGRNARM